jgi:hypothetical protein
MNLLGEEAGSVINVGVLWQTFLKEVKLVDSWK